MEILNIYLQICNSMAFQSEIPENCKILEIIGSQKPT